MNLLKLAFPNKFLGCRVFSENVLSISLNYNSVQLSMTKFTSTSKTVTNVGSFSVEGKPLINKFGEFDQTTINTVFANVKEFCSKIKVDKIILVIPSNICVFKDIEVPFKDKLKIDSIIEMQIDGLLPAEAQHMSFDFALWPTSKDGVNTIFLAALESKNLMALQKLASKNGIEIDLITVDAFCYANALLQKGQIPESQAIIVIIGEESSKIVFIKNNCINFVKNLQTSYDNIFENISKKLGQTDSKSIEQFLQFDMEQSSESIDIAVAFKSELQTLVQSILTNVESISSKTGILSDRIYVMSELPYTKQLLNLIGQSGNFVGVEISQDNFLAKYNVKNRAVFGTANISKWQLPIIAAVIYDSEFDFNVGRKVLALSATKRMNWKLYTMLFLFGTLLAYLVGLSAWRVSKIRTLEKTESATLTQDLKKNLSDIGVTMPARTDYKKMLAELDKNIDDLTKTAFLYEGTQQNLLELVFCITKCVDKLGQKVTIEKIKFYVDPEQKALFYKIKGSFERSQTKEEAEKFFNLLKFNSKYDSYELKKKDSDSQFSVTFMKQNE